MDSPLWLLWYVTAVKQWLGTAVAAEITAVYETQQAADETAGQGASISVDAVARAVYEYVRVAAYLAWLGQTFYMWVQALQHGRTLRYMPSMPGVNPRIVETIIREELRLTDGRITAPVKGTIARLNLRLTSLTPSIARATGVHTVEDEIPDRRASLLYSLENGSPVGRLIETVYGEHTDSPIRGVFDRDPTAHQLIDTAISEFTTVYDQVAGDDKLTVTQGMIDHWRVLKPNLTRAQMDVFAQAYRCAALAEIDLVEDIPERVYPNTWYYEWRENPRTGKAEYVVPPNNQVFSWLTYTRELGQNTQLKYFTPEQYRQRALEIVKSLPDEWFIDHNLRWARVPTGEYTCAFCLVLASRGAVYHSESSAQLNGFDHDGCDCLIVPVYDEDDYPLKNVVDAAKELYEKYRDEFQVKYSRNMYETTVRGGKNKGKKVLRHKTYVNIPRSRLAEITAHMPRVDNSGYRAWVKKHEASLGR